MDKILIKNTYLKKLKSYKIISSGKKKKFKLLYMCLIIICFIILFSYEFKYIIKKIKIGQKQNINEANNNTFLRKEMFEILSRLSNKNTTSLVDVYIGYHYKLGNSLLALNKILFYCEILQCKRILLNKCHSQFIKNTIYDKKYNLKIEPFENTNKENVNSAFFWPHPYYTILKILPENRFEVFKEEMIKNLPLIQINANDLYIHIRTGDVYFRPILGRYYGQPPFCFYKKVIEFKKFNNIFIISEDDNYPIIKRLIAEYKNVIYKKNSLEDDVSTLVHAYNIVGSISSFLTSLIKLNDNLKYFWEYDIYHKATKINHLHYSISNFVRKYTIYKMRPSKAYKKKMYIWNRTQEQLDLMINDNCPYDFEVIKPNV